jgi:5-methylthioadenosine/S-adenosylhomocysteine deaminase
MSQQVDLIIKARWLLPIVPQNSLYEDYAVVVDAGIMIDICPSVQAESQYHPKDTVNLDAHVLMPGFINLHTHAAMSLMRGLADDVGLMPWLNQHIWPAEAQVVSPIFVHDGTLLACAEMLSGGVTTFNDMYFYPAAAAEASLKAGMRANLGLVVLDFPTQYASDASDYLAKGTAVRDQYSNQSQLTFSFAPHAPYTVSDQAFSQIVMIAEQLDVSMHSHLHETHDEIQLSMQTYGMRPLARLEKLGMLTAGSTFAHCVHLNELEIQLMAANNCSIAHCPSSNLKLASGIAPIAAYAKQGINIGLGTDGAASNNRLDLFAEMRLSALLAKGQSGDATAINAHEALRMATINGAKALNLHEKVGSIEIGKRADLCAVQLSDVEMQPCFDPVSHLVYVAGREQVSHTWVDGDLKYHKPNESKGVYSHIEPQELSHIINKWTPKLKAYKA